MARLFIPTDQSAQVQWNTDSQLYSPRHLHRHSACSPSFGMQAGAAVAYTQAATSYADATVDFAAIGDCTSAAGASTSCTVNAGKAIANGARKCVEHQSHGSEGFFFSCSFTRLVMQLLICKPAQMHLVAACCRQVTTDRHCYGRPISPPTAAILTSGVL